MKKRIIYAISIVFLCGFSPSMGCLASNNALPTADPLEKNNSPDAILRKEEKSKNPCIVDCLKKTGGKGVVSCEQICVVPQKPPKPVPQEPEEDTSMEGIAPKIPEEE